MSDKKLDQSEIERNQAEAEKFRAERDEAAAEARKKTAEAEVAEISLAAKRRAEEDELAKNVHHKVYVFDSDVNSSSVKSCKNQLTIWHRNCPNCEVEIQVNSPGGSIVDGFDLIDFIRDFRNKGHKVSMVAFGYAASMAGVIMQAADTRVMGKHAFMLIHEGSLGAIGDFGKVEDRLKLMENFHTKILELFEERAKPKNSKTTKAFIKKRWHRNDWWLPSEEALRLGFIDEVR